MLLFIVFIEIFQEQCPNQKSISLDKFKKVLNLIISLSGELDVSDTTDESSLNIQSEVIDRLFKIFDQNKDGKVDFVELVSGLSILCSGSKEDKVSAAFSLFDYNGDGKISMEEMIVYLKSVFRVIYETTPPPVAYNIEVTPELLAKSTALQCFQDCDINRDGFLSLNEFSKWYTSSSV